MWREGCSRFLGGTERLVNPLQNSVTLKWSQLDFDMLPKLGNFTPPPPRYRTHGELLSFG
jgi:hypothetical protein